MLTDSEINRLAAALVEQLQKPSVLVVDLNEAMARTGFKSDTAFHRWAKAVGVRPMQGARGRYSVAALTNAVDRAARGKARG